MFFFIVLAPGPITLLPASWSGRKPHTLYHQKVLSLGIWNPIPNTNPNHNFPDGKQNRRPDNVNTVEPLFYDHPQNRIGVVVKDGWCPQGA